MTAPRAALSPRTQALLAAVSHTSHVSPLIDRPSLVKGWLAPAGLSVVFGSSNVGKSFFALDLAHHVGAGAEWNGCRVRKGNALYLAVEGGGNFINRVAALDDPAFWFLALPVALVGPQSDASALVAMIDCLAEVQGRFDFIILDTMARVMVGADENTAPAIADLMLNLDLIRSRTGAHVMLIHHSGKDAARGARGHSSLRAAVDTEIELTRDDSGTITAEVTKQREGPTGARFSYVLRQVELGRDQDGDPVTSCVVQAASDRGDKNGAPQLTGPAAMVLDTLDRLLAGAGDMVAAAELCRVSIEAGLSKGGTPAAQRMAFVRALRTLEAGGYVIVEGETIRRSAPF